MKLFLSAAVCLLLAARASAGPTFTSGSRQVPLLELFTSEGCSSCPPAERYLSGLTGDAGLWKSFVPVAYHVTYWDNLGWKDVTGQSGFNDRERAYAASWGTDTVYTPCFVRNGAEWHPAGQPPIGGAAETGVLQITKTDASTVQIVFTPAKNSAPATSVTVALLGNGIVSKIARGENAGRSLAHDFAVLVLKTTPLTAGPAGQLVATITLPKSESAPRLALAAWVDGKNGLSPLQATGGWLN